MAHTAWRTHTHTHGTSWGLPSLRSRRHGVDHLLDAEVATQVAHARIDGPEGRRSGGSRVGRPSFGYPNREAGKHI